MQETKKTFYHGSMTKFETFNLDHSGTNGSAQGAGVYLSPNVELAEMYAIKNETLGYIYEVEVQLKESLSEEKRTIDSENLSKILYHLDNEEIDILSNFGDESYEGKTAVMQRAFDLINKNSNDVDLFNEISNICGESLEVARVFESVANITHIESYEQTRLKEQVIVVLNPENVKITRVQDLALFKNHEVQTTIKELKNVDLEISKQTDRVDSTNGKLQKLMSERDWSKIEGDILYNQGKLSKEISVLNILKDEKLGLEKQLESHGIITGSMLSGAHDYAVDLSVANAIGKDVDAADIPGDTPEERRGLTERMNDAKDVHQNQTRTDSSQKELGTER